MANVNTNLSEYTSEVKKYYEQLAETSGDEAASKLKELLLYVLKKYEDGEIDSKEMSYAIAGTMQFSVANSDRFTELTGLAGELELPDAHISGEPAAKLQHLITLIKNV